MPPVLLPQVGGLGLSACEKAGPPSGCLDALLGSGAEVTHRTRRGLFCEKRLVCAQGAQHVLYRFAWPQQARLLSSMLGEAERRALGLQPLQGATGSWLEAMRQRGFWVACAYVQGEVWSHSHAQAAHMAALGTTLAGFHALPLPLPAGSSSLWLGWSKVRATRQVFRECHEAVASSPGMSHEQRQSLLTWLKGPSASAALARPLQLTHGDLHAKNVIVQPHDGVCLIDYELTKPDHACLELALALIRFTTQAGPTMRSSFLQAYFSQAPQTDRLHWQAHGATLLALGFLRMAWLRRRRMLILRRRGKTAQALPVGQRFERYVRHAFLLAEHQRTTGDNPEALLDQVSLHVG